MTSDSAFSCFLNLTYHGSGTSLADLSFSENYSENYPEDFLLPDIFFEIFYDNFPQDCDLDDYNFSKIHHNRFIYAESASRVTRPPPRTPPNRLLIGFDLLTSITCSF